MAIVSATEIGTLNPDFTRIAWFNMTEGDIGEALLTPGFEVLSIQTFGNYANGRIAFQGNNSEDPAQFYTIELSNRSLFYIAKNILEHRIGQVYYLRPIVVNGSIDTDISIVLLLKKV